MPAVNGVGEPCAGEPHARFEAAGAGNGADLTMSTEVAQPAGKPAEHEGPRLYRQRATAPAPDPTLAVEQSLTVDQMAHTFAVYPSLSGSLTEAARRLMRPGGDRR